jgi:hypothetical protein
VAAHEDDLLGAQPSGGQDRRQSHRAVADHRHRRALVDAGGHGTVVAGAEHVRQGEQGRQQLGILTDGQLDQRALGLRDAYGLALAAVHAVGPPQAAVPAGGLQALAAEVAGVVRPDERRQHDVPAPQPGHLPAEVLHDAEELVPDPLALLGGRPGLVRPQVAAADARAEHADQGVGGCPQDRVGHVLHAHVTGTVDQGCTHESLPSFG